MADESTDVDMSDTSDRQNNAGVVSDHPIPGGEPQPEPVDPAVAEAVDTDPMGCVGSSAHGAEDDNHAGEAGSTYRQKKNQQSASAVSKDGAHQQIVKDYSSNTSKPGHDKSNSRSASGNSRGQTSDDENYRQKSPRRVTRSSANLSPIRIIFEDSDDDDDQRYASSSKRDVLEYRRNYPNARSNPRVHDNLDFYTKKIPSSPDGDFIDNIHKNWFDDLRKLEFHHGYIQWLFPLQEKGLNWSAQPLQKHEIESIKKDNRALQRILTSYKMMLHFYGFELINEESGEIHRLPNDDYKLRFRNLNTSSHNYLRITRILKCLGEFDYEYLKFPFLAAILRESITEDTLPNCLRSCKDYWIETLRSRDERRAIRQYARELVEYRNKKISPPPAHRANRPPLAQTPTPQNSAAHRDGNMSS